MRLTEKLGFINPSAAKCEEGEMHKEAVLSGEDSENRSV